jgi:chromosome partitioning protein
MRKIAILNLKGGSGKTTTTLNLAVGIARSLPKKNRVLAIDADAQSNLSMTILDGHAAASPTLGHVLLGQADAVDAIRTTRIPQLDVLPAAGHLANATLQLAEEWGRENRLRQALETVEDVYEFVLIDCPPSLSLLSINCLRAATDVLVPIEGVYSVAGLGRLNDTIDLVRKNLDHDPLHVIGLVLTKAMKNPAGTALEQHLRETFGDLVYRTVIPYDAKVEEGIAHHRSVLEHAPTSKAAVAFGELIKEVLKHGQQQNPNPRRSVPKNAGPAGRRKKRRAG